MAILTNSGRVVMAKAVAAQAIHMAWGTGSAGWDATPVAVTPESTGLVNEVGRRLVTSVQYVTPNENGSIVVPNGKFNLSGTPTRYLFLRFSFDFTDAPTSDIREVAVFVGTTTDPALPGGQMYFAPSDIVDPGIQLLADRVNKFTRSPSVRQAFEFVATF
jgi:hypothetical protein